MVKIDSIDLNFVLEKDVKDLVSKQFFARWQVISSCFNFDILPIIRKQNAPS